MSSFNTPDESVQDTVAQLINQAANTDVVYNDANDTLTVSLTDSVSVNTLEADTITDGADVRHSDELADAADVSPIQSSSDVTVTDTQTGTVSDGEFLKNSDGSLTGGTVQTEPNVPAWQEDANSPVQPQNGFGSITLSDDYKAIKMIVMMTGGSTTYFDITVNDLSNGYEFRTVTGTQVNAGSFEEAIGNARGQVLDMTGKAYWPTADSTGVVGLTTNISQNNNGCAYGQNGYISNQYVNKISFSGDGDANIRVYGLK